MTAGVDPSFDYFSGTPPGKDPDTHSPTLRRHHQLLWNKELPTGGRFNLAPEPGAHLVYRSASGVFFLASDAITTRMRGKASRVRREIPNDDMPVYRGYTAGSTLVFPGNSIGRKMTINRARGLHPRIADRFDLTLECIRRHYLGELPNPLGDVMNRYADFFALFENFAGYVKFFLLKDLVEEDGKTVRFFHTFDDFRTPAVPKTKDEYLEYLRSSEDFITARSSTIDAEP
ncbi:hypothetical protein AU252_20345 [Pseudarthrobacter sulfonivorans]|uniref:Uncharacterized protein n=1 Tax=Pseudarthrobacter sulfonivorans TaxID=121292 RepID=A0A0U3PFS1_9MICC|nr:hypothetical protein [Pseudarthrobacter sulfonivorans]ALV43219.1 hypothetical protein AU252_20345 [Pseudarthrobacter sulfonivorans]